VQRLFSMFPAGMAGAALLVLRLCVASTLIVAGTARGASAASPWIILALAVPAISLCLGFITPYCSALAFLIQLGLLLVAGGENQFAFIIFLLNSAILAALGPGAYSIDARIFGRRLLTVPPRR
jgi:uncharacterized membrane protein YphA (DoxX/SURF4 family)